MRKEGSQTNRRLFDCLEVCWGVSGLQMRSRCKQQRERKKKTPKDQEEKSLKENDPEKSQREGDSEIAGCL